MFDQPLDPATVTDQTFVVQGLQSWRFLAPPNFISGSDSVANMTPGFGIDFHAGEMAQGTVTSGITNGAGEASQRRVWQFRVGAGGGSGYFSADQAFGTSGAVGIALGDLDGDTDLDAFVSRTTGNEVWRNSDGTYTLAQNLGGSGARVVLGDVNGDGHLDAIADRVYLYNPGTIQFTSGQTASGNSLGDIDADGDLDLVGTSVWRNDGSGGLLAGQSLGGQGVLGDVDNDGDLDIFVARPNQGNQVWRNDGSGTFTNSGQTVGTSDTQAVDLGDVDGDGDLDGWWGTARAKPTDCGSTMARGSSPMADAGPCRQYARSETGGSGW